MRSKKKKIGGKKLKRAEGAQWNTLSEVKTLGSTVAPQSLSHVSLVFGIFATGNLQLGFQSRYDSLLRFLMLTFIFLAIAGSGVPPSPWRGLKPKKLPLSNPVICIIHAYSHLCIYMFFLLMASERSLAGGKKKEVKKETGLGLTHRKAENFGEWYSEVF